VRGEKVPKADEGFVFSPEAISSYVVVLVGGALVSVVSVVPVVPVVLVVGVLLDVAVGGFPGRGG
jgi:hypothetical protein